MGAALIIVSAVALIAIALLLFPKFKKPVKNEVAPIDALLGDVFAWVNLPWFGEMRPFYLRKINLLSAMTSGEFPNILLTETMTKLSEDKKSNVQSIEKLSPERQMAFIKEQKVLLEKIARMSMTDPKYDDLRDKIRAQAGSDWEYDLAFLRAILDYQASGVPLGVKKKRPLFVLPV